MYNYITVLTIYNHTHACSTNISYRELTKVVESWLTQQFRIIAQLFAGSQSAHAPRVPEEVPTSSERVQLFHPSFFRSPVLKPNLQRQETKKCDKVVNFTQGRNITTLSISRKGEARFRCEVSYSVSSAAAV